MPSQKKNKDDLKEESTEIFIAGKKFDQIHQCITNKTSSKEVKNGQG